MVAAAVGLWLARPAAAQSRRVQFIELLKQANPKYVFNEARTNWREGRFYSTDLKGPGPNGTHPTWQAALKASLEPVDMHANVHAAVMNRIHPFKIFGNLIDPLGVEFQREIASGEGVSAAKLAQQLHPVMIASTMIAGSAGDIAGAVVQSTLARFGPLGAAAGFFARPMLGYAGTIFGMNVGDSMIHGGSFKQAVADSLRAIRPGRDGGQLVGGVIGGTLGQVLIPIPVVGGIVGGLIGGTVGAMVGNSLAGMWPFNKVERGITGFLGRLADRIEGKGGEKEKAKAQVAPVAPSGADHAPALGPTVASSAPAAAPESTAPRVAPQDAFPNPLASR